MNSQSLLHKPRQYRDLERIRILYLSPNSNIQGPIPKIDSLLISALNHSGCQIIKSPWGRHSDDENFIRKVYGRLGDIIKAFLILIRIHPDILYIATTLDKKTLARDIPLLVITYGSSAKKVLMMHGSQSGNLVDSGHNWFKMFSKLLIQLSHAILVLSTEELREWKEFAPNGKYYKVDNPFRRAEPTEFIQTSVVIKKETCPRLLFVGRLIKTKGILDLLDAMPAILSQVECHLLIAGIGEEKDAIIQRIEKAGLNDSVSLLGYLDSHQLTEIYKSCSIFILPTYNEGFPTAIIEAMGFGLPIVTTKLRGVRDHLQDGINALFVSPKDPKAIANAVLHLLGNPELCLNMRQANLTKIQEFEPDHVAPMYVKIFFELLER